MLNSAMGLSCRMFNRAHFLKFLYKKITYFFARFPRKVMPYCLCINTLIQEYVWSLGWQCASIWPACVACRGCVGGGTMSTSVQISTTPPRYFVIVRIPVSGQLSRE